MRCVTITLLLLVTAACGGGSEGAAPAGSTPAVLAITGPLAAAGGAAFTITGSDFPGGVSDVVTVEFRADAGAPFDACTSATLTQQAVYESPTSIRGSSVADVFVGDFRCYVTLTFPDGTEVASATPIAAFAGLVDVALDHDLDGTHDRCDPKTYDFEGDAAGARPADTAQVDGANPGFVVKDVAGDKAAHYAAGAGSTASDVLTRLRCDMPHQDLTAWIDFDDVPGAAHIEFWSDGSYLGNAGAGLLLQVLNTGELRLYQRVWRSLPVAVGPLLPASGRIRVRLIKGPAATSTMHVDAWENGAWASDHAVFPIVDDTWFTGRDVAVAEYGASTRGIKRITVRCEAPPAALTLTDDPQSAASWKLFQRDGADEATVPVRFLYRLPAGGRMQARVVDAGTQNALPGHDWGAHETTLAAADGARGMLAVVGIPAGGNYDVQVRLLDAAAQVVAQAQLDEIAVGDVYLCIGQSNMAGYSGNLTGATTPIPEVHLLRNSDTWVQAAEPCDAGSFQRDRISFENPVHSLMLPFGKALYAAAGVPVGLVPAPLGGTNLYAQWQRNVADPDHRGTLYGSALRRGRLCGGNPIRGMLWYQGESDAIAGRTTAQYRADLEQLIAQYRSDLSAPDAIFLCVQLGTWSGGGFPSWTNVQEAERQVCRADARAALATVVDQPRSDGIHYSVAGYQELGQRLADQARVLVFGHALDPLAELSEVAAVAGGMAIELRYDAPVSGGVASLFAVSDDAGAPTVTGVSTAGSTVTLQLDRALSTNPLVRYGLSTLPTAAWIEDAAGVPVPCFADVPLP